MDPAENEHSSEGEEATTSMASIARKSCPPDLASNGAAPTGTDVKKVPSNFNKAIGTATGPNTRNMPPKYRHIAAVHSRARTSCLSRDTEFVPSFLGFRNLMVIVLSTYLFIMKSCEFREKFFQHELIKSLQSCDESATCHRKFHESKASQIHALIDTSLTRSPVRSPDMYTLPRLS